MGSSFPRWIVLSLAAGVGILPVRAAEEPPSSWFASRIAADQVDVDACCVYDVAAKTKCPAVADELLAILGLGGGPSQRWAPEQTGPIQGEERTFHYVISFRQEIEPGTVLLAGTPQSLAVLKPDAPYPPDPADDTLWQPVDVPARQPSARLVPVPVGLRTRAVRLTDRRGRGWSRVDWVRLLTARLLNLTPYAYPYAESEYTTVSTGHGPSHTYYATGITTGRDAWQNTGPNAEGRVERRPISEIDPAWYLLTWKDRQSIEGLWLASDIEKLEVDYFDGADHLNPRAGTEKEWKKIRQMRVVNDRGLRLEFAPVRTRGLRLRILKVSDQAATVRIAMAHVITQLGDRAAPALPVAEITEPPVTVRFDLESEGIVTAVVNDSEGRRVRNLMARVNRPAGETSLHWDLRDEDGLTVPPGTYQWVAITHPGLALRYEMTPYPNVVDHSPENAPWLTSMSGPDGWMADHTPPRAATTAGDRVYLGSPVSESGVSLIECDLTGKKLWAHPSFAGFTGVWWLGADEKTVYVGAVAHNTAHAWNVDPSTEPIWAVDRQTHEVRELARLSPTAERKRGIQGMAARDGKLYLSVRAPVDWMANAASSADVDITRCIPVYKERRKERFMYEIVPDPRNDFLRLFRLTGNPPGGGASIGGGLIWLESTRGPSQRQHIVLSFKKPVALGSVVYPVPQDPKTRMRLSVLKTDAPYPPNPGRHQDWLPFSFSGEAPWDVAAAPSNTVTRALRISFVRGEDDLFTQTDESALFGAEKALEAIIDEGIGKEATAEDDPASWTARLEGMKLLGRRFENVAPRAQVRVSSGRVAADGTWDAERKTPLHEGDPGIYALEWTTPQKLRGLAIREIDGKLTKIDVYTGPTEGAIPLTGSEGWQEVATYEQERRDHHGGFPSYNGQARYLDGYVDFGQQIETRAVRLRVVEQWSDNLPDSRGIRADLGGMTLDPRRCRVFGVAALRYLGGETPHDPLIYHRLEVLDSASGQVVQEVSVPDPGPIAFTPSGELLAISGQTVIQVDLTGGKHQTLANDLIRPQAIALDSQGSIYVYDQAPDRQVIRVYDASGRYQRDIGQPGGYQVGPWNPQRFNNLTALAIDQQDHLWAVDTTYYPKRISLWDAPSGQHFKDFFGNTAYGGGGVLDPWDKRRLFYGPLEFELNWETGRTRLKNLTWLGETPAGQIPIKIGDRIYMVTRFREAGAGQHCGIVYLYEQDHLKLAAAMGHAEAFEPLRRPDLQAGLGFKILKDYKFIWTDHNGDGDVQTEEVVLAPKPAHMSPLTIFNRDLGIQAGKIRYQVKEFLPTGVPVYEEKVYSNLPEGDLYRLDNGSFHRMADGNSLSPEQVFDPEGRRIWSYPTLGSGGHAIGRAQHWSTDQVVCQFGIIGHETAPRGDLGEFWIFHNNLGVWNLWTADGLLASQVFRDLRDPKVRHWNFRQHDRGMELKDITVGQEHFSGYLTRTFEDDKFYVIAGHNHASVVEVIGLDQFKRLGGPLVVSVDDLVKTQEWEKNRQQEKVYERSPVIDCYRLAPSPAIDGRSDDWPTVSAELPGRARFRIGYDDHNLYLCYETGGMGPLKNSGQQWDRLFKTGAAADLQIATDPAAPEDRKAPVAGDQRLLMTYMNGKPIAVLYNAVVPGTPADQVWQAISPVAKVYFDKVEKRDDVRLATSRAGYGYVLEAAVPLAALGLKPEPNLRLKIDWGVLVTDEEGNAVLRREYWANKATGIIADVPSEAMLNPSLWGHVLFHGAGGQLAERLPKPDFEPRDPTMDKMLQEFEGELEDDLP